MFELSHRLIGIYKTANQTRSEWPLHLSNVCPLTRLAGISIDNHALHAIPVNTVSVAG